MAQRHTVYLKKSAARITPRQLLAGIREIDLGEIAEVCGVSLDLAQEAHDNLRIEKIEPRGFTFYRLFYRPGAQRQVDIHRWRSQAQVKGVIAEVLDNLDLTNPAAAKVQEFLGGCVDIVSASYGSMPGEAMAPILGSEVCRWLAEKLGGIIRDPGDDWFELGDWPDLKPL
jgi:hypothetical protein